ncbi:hypothetical protein ACFVAD_15580 [Sutcliffiella sp. NPDC057660]|uniref:hypothetical protein n=1 Tax=Sutcliffiella sp. NPDC057660 TaxID=3346199 RepID=UPI0036751D5F
MEHCQHFSKGHVHRYIEIFSKESLPVPRGMTSEDVDGTAVDESGCEERKKRP